jgi:6-phosphogluconate dehydrogenase
MEIGLVGLGRMGRNIARRLMTKGHTVVVFDQDRKALSELGSQGASSCLSLQDLVRKLAQPRVIWIMLPAGKDTENTITALGADMAPDDTIIDGENTFWQDDIRRAGTLRARGIHYVDVGTSGGVWGLERGFCLMIGGDDAVVERLNSIFTALAPGRDERARTGDRELKDARAEYGYLHAGPSGAGHFLKMVHNNIEYGLMQASQKALTSLEMQRAIPFRNSIDFNLTLGILLKFGGTAAL